MSDKDSLWVLFTHTSSRYSGRLRRKLADSGTRQWAIAPDRKTMLLVKKANFQRYVSKLAEEFHAEYVVVEAEILPSELQLLPCGGYVYDVDDQRRTARWAGHQANCSNCLALSPNQTKAKGRKLDDGSSNGANGQKPQGDEPESPTQDSDAIKALRAHQPLILGKTGDFNSLLTLVKSLGDDALAIAKECDTLVSALVGLAGAEDQVNDLKIQMSTHRERLTELLKQGSESPG